MYRRLHKDEIIKAGDEIDRCANPWHDDPIWVTVHPASVGGKAPDPAYPAHRQYRRRVCEWQVNMEVTHESPTS